MRSKSFLSLVSAGILLPLFASSALAATRTVYFSQTGRNTTVQGIASAVSSTCVITLTNTSGVNQTYAITMSGTNTGTKVSGAGGTFTNTAPAGVSLTGQSLANNASANHTITFQSYPARANVETGSQLLVCSGSITVDDPTPATPGFITASGVLVTFVEAGELTTTSVTGGGLWNGFAVFSQVPMMINGGRPF